MITELKPSPRKRNKKTQTLKRQLTKGILQIARKLLRYSDKYAAAAMGLRDSRKVQWIFHYSYLNTKG